MSVSEQEFEFLKENCKHLRSKVTRKCNYISENFNVLTFTEKDEEIINLKLLRERLLKLYEYISKGLCIHVSERSLINAELDKCDEFDDKIVKVQKSLEPVCLLE